MQKTPVVVVDIETTGLSPYRHKITEIAAIKVLNGKIVNQFEQLINPETHIPSFITKLTGIHDALVADAPTVDEVIPEFQSFLGEEVFVAHNASFDHKFIAHNIHKHQKEHMRNEKLCTQKLANRILPDLHSKRLGVICEHYGVDNKQAHRAMGDTLATVEVFGKMMDALKENNITKIHEVLSFERMLRSKASGLLTKK